MPTPTLADSDVFPRIREDIPRPASKTRQRNQPKARGGRPSRSKHDDDDDWPSTEWDKLSDEQYWAELSADKPLATTARSAPRPAARPRPSRSAASSAHRHTPPGPTGTPRPDRDRAVAGPDRTDRMGSRRSRDRAGQDDATQQLDARPAGRSGSRPPAARPRGGQVPEAADRGWPGGGLAPSRPRRTVRPGPRLRGDRANAVPQPVAQRGRPAAQRLLRSAPARPPARSAPTRPLARSALTRPLARSAPTPPPARSAPGRSARPSPPRGGPRPVARPWTTR